MDYLGVHMTKDRIKATSIFMGITTTICAGASLIYYFTKD